MSTTPPLIETRLIGDGLLPAGLRGVTVDPARLEPSWCAAWDRLCHANPDYAHPFLTAAYAAAVARVRPLVRLFVLLDHDTPVAFLPYQFPSSRHAFLGWAETVGGHMTDYFGVVAAPGLRFTPAGLLRAAGLHYLYFGQLDGAQSALGLEGHHEVTGLLIRFPQGGDAYWAEITARDKDFAVRTQRKQRQLEAAHGAVRLETEATSAAAALDLLIEEKRAQYVRTRSDDALAEPWTRNLLHELLASTDALCAGSMLTLYAGETRAAAHFGLQTLDGLHYWFPTYVQELSRFSPGRLLVRSFAMEGARLGITNVDCGIGDARAKADFANDSHRLFRGAWHTPGPRAFTARAIQSLSWRYQAWKTSRAAAGPEA